MHFLRPDFTYITSVRQPIGGFQPQPDVMGVVDQFTNQARLFQMGDTAPASTPMSGLGRPVVRLMGLGRAPRVQLMAPKKTVYIKASAGPIARAWTRLLAWGKGHKAVQLSGLRGPIPYGPRQWIGPQLVPGPSQEMLALLAYAQGMQPSNIGPQNTTVILNRWNRNY